MWYFLCSLLMPSPCFIVDFHSSLQPSLPRILVVVAPVRLPRHSLLLFVASKRSSYFLDFYRFHYAYQQCCSWALQLKTRLWSTALPNCCWGQILLMPYPFDPSQDDCWQLVDHTNDFDSNTKARYPLYNCFVSSKAIKIFHSLEETLGLIFFKRWPMTGKRRQIFVKLIVVACGSSFMFVHFLVGIRLPRDLIDHPCPLAISLTRFCCVCHRWSKTIKRNSSFQHMNKNNEATHQQSAILSLCSMPATSATIESVLVASRSI